MTKQVLDRAKRKASQSECSHKISAIGLDKHGNYLTSAINKRRFFHKGGGFHAEIELIRRAGPQLHTIVLCRVNQSGDCLPIHPCANCQRVINKLGLKVVTLEQ